MHSAKGLEFDHVMILGLDAEVTEHGEDPDDDEYINLRRLFAMSIMRARTTVLVGYHPDRPSDLIELLDPRTFQLIEV